MRHRKTPWKSLTKQARSKRLLQMFVLERNAEMTAKDAAKAFGDITRGCITVHCQRCGIHLPRTRDGRKFYEHCRHMGIVPRAKRMRTRKY